MGRLYEAPEGRIAQEMQGFLGVNLRKDRLSLADEEMAKLINGDIHRQPGAIVIRLPRREQFATALTDTTIRRLAKVNGKRYQVAGLSLYRDQTVIGDSILHVDKRTTIVPFRPFNDVSTYAFVADRGTMRKDDGTDLTLWGIAAPIVAPTTAAAATGSGALSGAYQAAYTYIRFTSGNVAHESNRSALSTSVTLSTDGLAIGDIVGSDDTQVNRFGIYRTVAGGTSALLDSREHEPNHNEDDVDGITHVFEVSMATTSGILHLHHSIPAGTYRATQAWEPSRETVSEDVDGYHVTHLWEIARDYVTTQRKRWCWHSTAADSALGTAAPTANDPPPRAAWATEFQGHILLADTVTARDRHRVYWSDRFEPESFDPDNFLEVGQPDDPIQCIHPLAGLAGIFTRLTKYRMTGNATSGFVAPEALSRRGTPCPYASKATEYGIVFLARDGVWRTNLLERDTELSARIAPIWYGEDANGIERINWDAIETACLDTYKGRLYLALPTGTSTVPNLLACYSAQTEHWYFFQYASAAPRTLFVEEDVDDLVAGFTDGLVYVLEDTEGTESVTLEAETKDYYGQTTSARKLFLWAKVDAEVPTDETLTVKLYVDGTLKRTTTVTGSRTKALLPFPEASLGYSWRINLTYTGVSDIRVYGAECLWAPMAVA